MPANMPRRDLSEAGKAAMRIDAHCHLWQIGRHDCTWPPPELGAIHRDFVPADWRREADGVGVDAAVVVQSQPSERDTAWLLELACDDACMAGVVGWTDLAAHDAPARIAALAAQPKLRGLRPMLQDLPDDDRILSTAWAPAIEAMVAHNLCFDALVKPRHLPYLARFAERHPNLRIVIDHAAKPAIARGVHDPWRERMAELAARPNVYCKFSGLLTEAGGQAGADALRPYADHLLMAFGPGRLLWGSDWPVLNLAGDYAGWFRMADRLASLHGEERAALFGGTACRVYGLADGRG